MTCYVVDASVGIKWFVPEVHSKLAQQLLSEENLLLVPDLFFPEIGNILWKRVRRGEDSPENARQTLIEFNNVPLEIYDSQPLTPAALEIAMQTDRTLYDSLYLALAVLRQCSMVTADSKLLNALANTDFADSIISLEALAVT
jgi:predicted nucleic acid-binding protein